MAAPTSTSQLTKIAEGREAELFAYGDGRVLRLYRRGVQAGGARVRSAGRPDDDPRADEVHYQMLVLRAAASGVRVPTPYEAVTVDSRPGIVLERIDGEDLFEIIARKPWRIWPYSRLVGRLHAEINSVPGPPELTDTRDWHRRALTHAGDAPPEFVEAALARLDTLPEGDRLLHGDFHPGNVMLAADGPVTIDWTNATRGSPETDLARTLMMLRLGEPPPSTPRLIRFFAHFARFLMIGTYNRTYRNTLPVDERLFRAWQLPVAVARITENIPGEIPKLHKFIRELIDRDTNAPNRSS